MTSWKENFEKWDAGREESGENWVDKVITPYEAGRYDGSLEVDLWWAERWANCRAGRYSLLKAPIINQEMDERAHEVLEESRLRKRKLREDTAND